MFTVTIGHLTLVNRKPSGPIISYKRILFPINVTRVYSVCYCIRRNGIGFITFLTKISGERLKWGVATSDSIPLPELHNSQPVSYTHLDVYKRQLW